MFLSKITILHIFYRFRDHETEKKICHTRRHKLQPNTLPRKSSLIKVEIIYFYL